MKIDLEKAKGMCVKTTPDINGSLFGHMQLEKIFNSGNKESGEFSLENGTYWFVQAIPVTDDSGKIIGILALSGTLLKERQSKNFSRKNR